jgi:excisionase family DNA binding protein
MESRLMPVPEAAKILAVSPATAWSLVGRGELESVKIGKSRRVSTDAISAFIAEHTDGGTE